MNTTLQAQRRVAPPAATSCARSRRPGRAAEGGVRSRGGAGPTAIHLSPATAAGLVRRAADGDAAAWDALVDAYGSMVWSVARSYRLGDADAADVFQSTWLHLLEHIHRLHDPGRIAGWLATTARRAALRIARHNARMLPTDRDLTHASWHADDSDRPAGGGGARGGDAARRSRRSRSATRRC